ncbi:MAG: CHAT domain-containing protein [Caldilineaceae bacterium]|nr:CHAT domain-containing protein [Caldilineaceae bacterium]
MAATKHLEFDLLIEKTASGYRARVLDSPGGQASREFVLPFSDLEVENFILRLGQARRGMRRMESSALAAAKEFGGKLFATVFAAEVNDCLQRSLAEAAGQNAGLRFRLRLSSAPELLDLPWELLYQPAQNRFLALSVETPLVRYLDLPGRVAPLAVTPPLNILVVVASPRDYPALDVEVEWQRLREAVRDLEVRGLLTVDRLETPTLAALQRQLRRKEYHVFHFIGHGGFDEQAQDGLLMLEDEHSNSRPVSGQYLGVLLHDEKSLRLALLNACEGGRTSRSDPFAGVCQSLLQQGVPAVIAMQFAISDQAAVALAHEFYGALADGLPVDTALTEARKAVFAQSNGVEWGTPVLYLRTADGHLFDLDREHATPALLPMPSPAPASAPDLTAPHRRTLAFAFGLLAIALVVLVALARLVGPFRIASESSVQVGAPATVATAAQAVATTPVAAAIPAPTVSDADYMFTFDNGSAMGWNGSPVQWSVPQDETGNWVYQGQAPAAGFTASSPPDIDILAQWEDYALQLRMRITRPNPPDDDYTDTWIAVRADTEAGAGCESYSIFFNSSYDEVLLAIGGGANCPYAPLARKAYPLELNQWYTVRVEAHGAQIALQIDGQPVLSATDTRRSQGFFYLTLGPDATVQFDDIAVWRLPA